MPGLKIFIYRPDKVPCKEVIPDLCYTLNGQNYRDWQRDQEEAYQYKIELIKQKAVKQKKNAHFIEVSW